MAEEAEAAEKPIRFGNHVVKLLEKIGKIPNSASEVFLWDLIRLAKGALYRYRLKRLDKRKIKYTGEDEDSDFVIKIEADEVNQTLSITHKGIGLERENDLMDEIGFITNDLVNNYLGTIDKYLMNGDPNAYYSADLNYSGDLYEECSLGFYSSFMVANRVVITTKEVVPNTERCRALENGNYPRPGDQLVWDASATGASFRIYRDDPKPEDRLKRGTKVTLYLKNEYLEYLDVTKLRKLVDKCTFDVCPYPIYLSADDHEREKKRQSTAGREEELESLKKDFAVLRELCVRALRRTRVEKVVVDDRVFDLPGHLSNDGKTFFINPRSPIMKSLLVEFNKNPPKKTKKVLIRFMHDFQLYSACPRMAHILKTKSKLRLYTETIIDDGEHVGDDDGERIDDDDDDDYGERSDIDENGESIDGDDGKKSIDDEDKESIDDEEEESIDDDNKESLMESINLCSIDDDDADEKVSIDDDNKESLMKSINLCSIDYDDFDEIMVDAFDESMVDVDDVASGRLC